MRRLFRKRLCEAMICATSRAGHGMDPQLLSSGCSVACPSSCTPLDRTAGALNLFSFRAGVWDTDAETTGAVLAAHAAAAILARRHGEQMQAALSTRDRIGQAKGIIMERYAVDDVRCLRDAAADITGKSNKTRRRCPTRHRDTWRQQLNPSAALAVWSTDTTYASIAACVTAIVQQSECWQEPIVLRFGSLALGTLSIATQSFSLASLSQWTRTNWFAILSRSVHLVLDRVNLRSKHA